MSQAAKQEKTLQIIPDDRGPEVIATAIEQVAEAANKLLSTRLSKRAVILLIHDLLGSKFGNKSTRKEIEAILDAARDLKKYIVAGK